MSSEPMVIGAADGEADEDVGAGAGAWSAAAMNRAVIADGASEYGPEPDHSSSSVNHYNDDGDEEDETLYERFSVYKDGSDEGAGGRRGCGERFVTKVLMITLLVFAYTMIFLASYFSMDPGGLASLTSNPDTVIKTGMILGMQDTSADVCTSVYERACGSYDKRYTQSSVFEETQLSILHDAQEMLPQSWATLQETLEAANNATFSTDTLRAMGFYGCVDVEIGPDVNDRADLAVYLSAPCYGTCLGTRHTQPPVPLGGLPSDAPPALTTLVDTMRGRNVQLYWVPLNSSYPSADRFVCEHNASEMFGRFLGELTEFGLANRFYSVDSLVRTVDISTLIRRVRMSMQWYLARAPFLATSAARTAFSNRALSVPIYVGGGNNALRPRCIVGTSLVECLSLQSQAALNAAISHTSVHASNLWEGSPMEVNAYYNPMSDAVYIPAGITQMPFFSTDWPEWIQMATLGAVIVHEIGHALRPEWFSLPHVAPEDNMSLSRFEGCIVSDFESIGVTEQRAQMTLSENWADAISARVTESYLRTINAQTARDGSIVWAQLWCAAGRPYYDPLSTDPHATDHNRANGTLGSMSVFYSLFSCAPPTGVALCT